MSDQTRESKVDRQLLGKLGEDAVAQRYSAEGYAVIARNVRIGHYELDLIAQNSTHLAFVEVKTRHATYGVRSRYGRPADAVDKAKRARTVAAAEAYLRAHRDELPVGIQPRIDIAEVYLGHRADGTYAVEHVILYRNAFGAR